VRSNFTGVRDRLSQLSLRHTPIGRFFLAPDLFVGFRRLASLDMSSAFLTTLPDGFFVPLEGTLTVLNIDENVMEVLPPTVLSLLQNSLVTLYVYLNGIFKF
jgi:hypothetical protein